MTTCKGIVKDNMVVLEDGARTLIGLRVAWRPTRSPFPCCYPAGEIVHRRPGGYADVSRPVGW